MKKAIINFIFLFLLGVVGCTKDKVDTDPAGQIPAVNDGIVFIDGPNLLKNGGLEVWDHSTYYDIPYEWYCHNNHNVKKNIEKVFEGFYSARMKSVKSGSTARIDQLVPVSPGYKIRIRFKYYVSKWEENGARTYCYFRTRQAESSNIPIAELRNFYSNEEYYIIRGGGYGLKYLPHALHTWLTFDETITVPPTANYFVFGVNSYYETTIYVDDCCVCELIPIISK